MLCDIESDIEIGLLCDAVLDCESEAVDVAVELSLRVGDFDTEDDNVVELEPLRVREVLAP